MDTNGSKPLTQQTRDTMAQTDHDKLVEYGVMLQTIMAGQLRLEQQIKDLVSGQSTALASWEATSKAIHETQDARIRKLEDLSNKYIPEYISKIDSMERDIDLIKEGKSEVLGGWKATVMIFGAMAGFASFIWIISQLVFHLKIL